MAAVKKNKTNPEKKERVSAKKKIVLAFSGGLDTSYCIPYLSDEKNYEVIAVTINTGGFDTAQAGELQKKALMLGASEFKFIEAEEIFYRQIVRFLIFGNVLRNQTYPLSVSAERIIQALQLIKTAKEIGAEAIAHGSTGAGNDQVRFDLIFQVMAPDIEIVTPIRDQKLSRIQEIDYLKNRGVDLPWEKAQYSINRGLWGTSVGGAETLGSRLALPEKAWPSQLLKNDKTDISLGFRKGEPVSLNGKEDHPRVIIKKLQKLAAPYAIGRGIHVGDTIIGIKGRVGFEAAAPLIIIAAHELLEKHLLTKWQLHHKTETGNWYGMLLHEGAYLDAVMRNFEAFLENSQQNVTGTVFISLHPYRYELNGIESANDLMNADFGNYGEENKAWTAADARGFIKITSNSHKVYHQINKKHD